MMNYLMANHGYRYQWFMTVMTKIQIWILKFLVNPFSRKLCKYYITIFFLNVPHVYIYEISSKITPPFVKKKYISNS